MTLDEFVTLVGELSADHGSSGIASEAWIDAFSQLVRSANVPSAFAEPLPAGTVTDPLILHTSTTLTVFAMAAAPGYLSAIHDHRCWGLVGQLQGCELEIRYRRSDPESGEPSPSAPVGLTPQGTRRLTPGSVIEIRPPHGDVHQVANIGEETSVTLHLFPRNIMRNGFNVYRPGLYHAQLIAQQQQ